jgi:hypothetical protein
MAASTADTESAQALFCALADYVGSTKIGDVFDLDKYPTYYDLTGYTGNGYKGTGYKKTLNVKLKNAKKSHEDSNKDLGLKEKFDENKFIEDFKTLSGRGITKSQENTWKIHNDYIKKSYDQIKVAGASGTIELLRLQKTLDEELGWYKSSVKTAKKLVEDIGNIKGNAPGGGGLFKIGNPAWNNIYYYRGDDDVMGTIGDLFKAANDNAKTNPNPKIQGPKSFGDINKWSPADMYLATDSCKKILKTMKKDYITNSKKGALTFNVLNDEISDQIDLGKLLPLSLKKITGEAHLLKVNFDAKTKKGVLDSIVYRGVSDWFPMKRQPADKSKAAMYTTLGGGFRFKPPMNGQGPIYTLADSEKSFRDIRLSFDVVEGGVPKKVSMQFRHTPTTKGKPQKGLKVVLGYEGASALAGQVVGIDWLCKLIGFHDSIFAANLKKTWNDSMDNFVKDGKAYVETGGELYHGLYPNFMADYKTQYNTYSSNKKAVVSWGTFNSTDNKKLTKDQQKKIYNADMGAISGVTVMNDFRTELDNYFNSKGDYSTTTDAMKTAVVTQIFQYASSRSVQSGKFVIAK